jgi:hypothetical protein
MSSRFSSAERASLLALKGVGPTVISRLEEIGYASLAQLAGESAEVITLRIAQRLASTCWHNSPQARAAITAVIALADEKEA